MRKTLFARLAGLALAAAAGNASATLLTFNGHSYDFNSTETVVAPFTSVSGVATAATYSGLVLVEVSGMGNGAWGGTNNDAFYRFDGQFPGTCGALGVRTLALPGGCNNYAYNAMVYSVEDDHFVSAAGGTYIPAFRAGHDYSFVLSVDKLLAANGQVTPQALRFGTTDGSYGDNGGAFNIRVSQLREAQAAVPEPGSLALAGLAALAAASRLRRRR